MADDACTKVMAEAIAGSVGLLRDELDRALGERRTADKRIDEIRAKVAEREAWLARVLEGVPMSKINAADPAAQQAGAAGSKP